MKQINLSHQKLTKFIKYLLVTDLLAYLTLMSSSAFAVTEVKLFTAIFILLLSISILVILYRTKELLRSRSLWMSISAFALVICAMASLILRYPSPNPMNQENPYTTTQETRIQEFTIPGWETIPPTAEDSTRVESSNSTYDEQQSTDSLSAIDSDI